MTQLDFLARQVGALHRRVLRLREQRGLMTHANPDAGNGGEEGHDREQEDFRLQAAVGEENWGGHDGVRGLSLQA